MGPRGQVEGLPLEWGIDTFVVHLGRNLQR